MKLVKPALWQSTINYEPSIAALTEVQNQRTIIVKRQVRNFLFTQILLRKEKKRRKKNNSCSGATALWLRPTSWLRLTSAKVPHNHFVLYTICYIILLFCRFHGITFCLFISYIMWNIISLYRFPGVFQATHHHLSQKEEELHWKPHAMVTMFLNPTWSRLNPVPDLLQGCAEVSPQWDTGLHSVSQKSKADR